MGYIIYRYVYCYFYCYVYICTVCQIFSNVKYLFLFFVTESELNKANSDIYF